MRALVHNTLYKRLVNFLSAIILSIISVTSITAQNPIANFTADKTSGCSPFTVTFTDQSTGNPTNWNWEFSNGQLTTGSATSRTCVYCCGVLYGQA